MGVVATDLVSPKDGDGAMLEAEEFAANIESTGCGIIRGSGTSS